MQFLINGVNIAPYVGFNGLEYQLSDVDSPNAGRNMAGEMERGKITEKEKWSLKFVPLTTSQIAAILSAVSDEYVEVSFLSPRHGSTVTKQMYVGDRSAAHMFERGGTVYWKDLSFSLIER